RTKHIRPKNEANLTEGQAERKRSLAKEHPRTARACAMEEALRAVYECGAREEAESELDAPCSRVMRSNIPQMKTAAKTIRENKAEIPNYFDHRKTNAVLEGMNLIIQSAKRQARGFSNLEYFKTIIYLNLGKLHFPQLAPCATH
ncbi:MAG: transposase, partial [Eggerthellaceae bacterium]|nr:transposase [Eggerthellaceae bacterium]